MDIFEYNDYRKMLQDWLVLEKKQHRMTASSLAERVGVHPTFISQVLKGAKDFSSEQWLATCSLMKLSELENDYLQVLLQQNRAGTKEARAYFQKKLDEILKRRLQLQERMKDHKQLTDEDRAVFYSSWIYSAVRLFAACEGGQTLEQLAEKFQISKSKMEEILGFLCRTGLCKFEKSKYHMGEQHVHVPANSPFVVRHHTNWRLRAINSLEQTTPEELNFTAPMSISNKDFTIIREKIVKLIQEAVEVAKASNSEDLATLTIDFFKPLK
ncbi:TIGR02147 family protein [Bdellovibrio sp. HCB274]|uniref:TIGR02147 family protein n=1 Tax=Bdellovibrio sp. HCB274 TaxID=3394361 RepID=UPI0039B3B04A